MRRNDRKIHDADAVERLVATNRTVVVAIPGEEHLAAPYPVPLSYGYRDGILWIHSAREGRKVEAARRGEKVGFCVIDTDEIVPGPGPCDWTSTYTSVIGTGTLELVDDPGEKRKGLDILMEGHGAKGPFEYSVPMDRLAILKLTVAEMTGKSSGQS